MSSLLRRFGGGIQTPRQASSTAHDVNEVKDGSLRFVEASGDNTGQTTFQLSAGAPVETTSPLKHNVGPVTIIFMCVGKMVGTGIFSTPSNILTRTGSVGLALLFWVFGAIFAAAGLTVYLEYAAFFPSRSGSEVAYLEQSYPRPRFFFPTVYALETVVLAFSSSNAIVLSNYLFAMAGTTATNWQTKGVAAASYTIATLFVIFNTRLSYWMSNGIGVIKLLTLVFIALIGFVVLGGHTRVENPTENFSNAFDGTTSVYGITNALYSVVYAYTGYNNVFYVTAEIKDPVRNLKKYGYTALLITFILYFLANIAYFAAVPAADLRAGREVAIRLLFTNVFGDSGAVRGLNFLIVISAFGNLITVLLGDSRAIRECGRQGVIPFTKFWVSTRPFGTTAGPYLLKWFLTIIVILAVPAGDAFQFMSNLQVYPNALFMLLLSVGIFFVRKRHGRLGLGKPAFSAWTVVVVFNILVQIYLLAIPWYPPPGGRNAGNVSFWYATYIVVALGVLALFSLYWVVWFKALPRVRGYRMRQEMLEYDDGAQSNRFVKVPVAELEVWDATHDALGRPLGQAQISETSSRGQEESIEIAKA
ncbi:Putative amino acid/polyamine transporter I [Septoria linicola]|uniref:Amino acid/polyamine transporter I n=1 Tax=Septoria linicola TaxID=215465 RepID=A0A9Q9AIQ3_9PEZI|nr:putative amino acid/polyamine transporter I [Septoria linicola]USW46918.1 Putative amino acid/polyamine transporter I [Septoria linicola]